jgi:hypothetical protein
MVLVTTGVGLRLWQYSGNASLDLDELALARNIVERPLRALLFAPLAFDQVAPKGFLLIEKGLVVVLGTTEYALRLFPLLCALTALVLFWRLAARVLRGLAAPLAVALFALQPTFILYGATVKQYSSDTAVAILLMLMALDLWQYGASRGRCVLLGAVGAVAAQCSQAAVLVLFGLGAALGLLAVRAWDRKSLRLLSVTMLLWAASAAAAVVAGLRTTTPATVAYLHLYWQGDFMPLLSGHAKTTVVWLWDKAYRMFDVGGLHAGWHKWPAVYIGLTGLGAWSLWRRRREVLLLLLGPVVVTLAASAGHHYPFEGRLVLFLVPAFLIVAAEGAEYARRVGPTRFMHVGSVGIALLAVLPLYDFMSHLPVYRNEDTKPMLAYVQARRVPSDAVYVYYGAWQAVQFYASQYGLKAGEYVLGGCHRGDTRAYLRELDQFRGRRVWVLFAHMLERFPERPMMVSYLDQIGVRLDSVALLPHMWDAPAVPDVYSYLYDLSHEERLASASAETYPLPRIKSPDPRSGCSAGPQVPVGEASVFLKRRGTEIDGTLGLLLTASQSKVWGR